MIVILGVLIDLMPAVDVVVCIPVLVLLVLVIGFLFVGDAVGRAASASICPVQVS